MRDRMRRAETCCARVGDSQVIEWEQFRNTAKDHKHGDREIHHATKIIISSAINQQLGY